jgi:uncharacterized repeat protein (TIGR04138 family)
MSHPLILDEDVACERCGYNLCGLPTRHACPECGEPYDECTEVDWLPPEFKAIARRIGFHADAVYMVRRGVTRAAEVAAAAAAPHAGGTAQLHVTALEVCRAFRDVVVEHFRDPDEARWLLAAWGLRDSEAVGAVVFGLIGEGQLRAAEGDSQADFDGLFVLDNLFENPHPVLDRAAASG